MKLDSKYFDSIRVSRGRSRQQRVEAPKQDAPLCQWRNCSKNGPHRAPKGRDREGEYYHFCREHVTEYNKSYDYFAGMNDGEVADYQKDAATGHRPTWSMGVHGSGPSAESVRQAGETGAAQDPFELLKKRRGGVHENVSHDYPRRRAISKGAKKHLQCLNLDETATPDEIKIQFKALVKLHHPDHNGGDRSSEERFREVLAAYNYLKQAGLVR